MDTQANKIVISHPSSIDDQAVIHIAEFSLGTMDKEQKSLDKMIMVLSRGKVSVHVDRSKPDLTTIDIKMEQSSGS